MTSPPSVPLVSVYAAPSDDPVQLPLMLTGTTDTRGVDLYPVLGPPVNDTVASVTSVTVTRLDGLPTNSTDLTVTPSGTVPPWIAPNLAGVTANAVAWWQGAGTAAQPGYDVTYQVEVTYVTTSGRALGVTCLQTVSATVG